MTRILIIIAMLCLTGCETAGFPRPPMHTQAKSLAGSGRDARATEGTLWRAKQGSNPSPAPKYEIWYPWECQSWKPWTPGTPLPPVTNADKGKIILPNGDDESWNRFKDGLKAIQSRVAKERLQKLLDENWRELGK